MEFDTKTTPYKTSDKSSFAYVSVRDRWPVILTQAIDDVFRHTTASNDPVYTREGKKIVEQLAKLKYEMQHDRVVTPLENDGQTDIQTYNDELEALGNLKWFEAPWLFIECYLYRRIQVCMNLSTKWKSHDVFHLQKNSTFKSSLAAVLELASKYHKIVAAIEGPTNSEKLTPDQTAEKEKLLFIEMCEICLWGNATDLSLLTSLSYEDIQKLQGSEARKNSEKNILVNDLPKVYDTLKKLESEGKEKRRVDIILDNSGFELFVDLILGGYLLSVGLATEIVFHPKSLPWFVSDVLPRDFADLLNALRDPVAYFASSEEPKEEKTELLTDTQKSDLGFLFGRWAQFHAEGQFVLRPSTFWTTAASYWRLPKAAPDLLEDLKDSELCIFKGDLNYRKLTGDADWDPTTRFAQAIGPFGEQGSGVRVLALRTCKADVVVGLPEGKDEELRSGDKKDEGRKWAWSGKWAVVQFWDGKE